MYCCGNRFSNDWLYARQLLHTTHMQHQRLFIFRLSHELWLCYTLVGRVSTTPRLLLQSYIRQTSLLGLGMQSTNHHAQSVCSVRVTYFASRCSLSGLLDSKATINSHHYPGDPLGVVAG